MSHSKKFEFIAGNLFLTDEAVAEMLTRQSLDEVRETLGLPRAIGKTDPIKDPVKTNRFIKAALLKNPDIYNDASSGMHKYVFGCPAEGKVGVINIAETLYVKDGIETVVTELQARKAVNPDEVEAATELLTETSKSEGKANFIENLKAWVEDAKTTALDFFAELIGKEIPTVTAEDVQDALETAKLTPEVVDITADTDLELIDTETVVDEIDDSAPETGDTLAPVLDAEVTTAVVVESDPLAALTARVAQTELGLKKVEADVANVKEVVLDKIDGLYSGLKDMFNAPAIAEKAE